MLPVKIVTHSRFVIDRALAHGWEAGARYTNLRDVRHLRRVYFLDIEWARYDFERHLAVAKRVRPQLTVARDVLDADELDATIREAEALARYAATVVIVPKDERLVAVARLGVPRTFRLGYSVATRYGGTSIAPSAFAGPVHLLGGRPDVQRRLAEEMNVVSLDGNRFTLDAKFGDYFDGVTFRPHPAGGYENCIEDSLRNIGNLWKHARGH